MAAPRKISPLVKRRIRDPEFYEFLEGITVQDDGSMLEIPPEQLLSYYAEAINASSIVPAVDMPDLVERLETPMMRLATRLQEVMMQAISRNRVRPTLQSHKKKVLVKPPSEDDDEKPVVETRPTFGGKGPYLRPHSSEQPPREVSPHKRN
jgi:hypothetical protein